MERLRLWCSVAWRVGLILYYPKLAQFSESFDLVGFAWASIASRDSVAEPNGCYRKLYSVRS